MVGSGGCVTGEFTLVENLSSIPVPEGHSYRLSNRYKLSGTKGPPFHTGCLRTGIKGPPRGPPGELRAKELWYRLVIRTGTKGSPRGREFSQISAAAENWLFRVLERFRDIGLIHIASMHQKRVWV
jgi:hypothetical protein